MKTRALVFASLVVGALADREYFENGKVCIAPQVTVTKTVYHTTVQGVKTADIDDEDHAYGQHPATGKKWPTGVYDAWASLSAKAWPWASASASAESNYEHGYGYDPKKPYNKAGVTSSATKSYNEKPGYGGDHNDYVTPSSTAAGYDGYKGDKDTYSKNDVYSKDGAGYTKDSTTYSKGPGYGNGQDPKSPSSLGPGHPVVGPSSAGHGGFPSLSRWTNSSSIATSKTSSARSSSKSSSVLSSSRTSSALLSSGSSSVSVSKTSSLSSSVTSNGSSASKPSSSSALSSSSSSFSSGSLFSSTASSISSSSIASSTTSAGSSSSSSLSSSSAESSPSSSSAASSTITSSSSSETSSASLSSSSSISSSISSSSSCSAYACGPITYANIGPRATPLPQMNCAVFDDNSQQIPAAELAFPVKIYNASSSIVWVNANGLISVNGDPGGSVAQERIPSDNVQNFPTVFAYWSDWYGFATDPCVQPYGVYYYTDAASFGVEWFVQYFDIRNPDERYRVQFSAQTFLATPGVWTYRYYKIPDRALTDALIEPPEYIGAQYGQTGPAVQYTGTRPSVGSTIVCDTNVGAGTCVQTN